MGNRSGFFFGEGSLGIWSRGGAGTTPKLIVPTSDLGSPTARFVASVPSFSVNATHRNLSLLPVIARVALVV
jgi:hypothetical protein